MRLWSSNLYKGNWFPVKEEPRMIDYNDRLKSRLQEAAAERHSQGEPSDEMPEGFLAGIDAETVDALLDPEGKNALLRSSSAEEQAQLEQQLEDARRELERIRQETESMLTDARAQIEDMRVSALEQAQAEGYQRGYEEGMAQVQQMKNECQARAAQLEAEYHQRMEELEPEFIENLTGIYEHIFKVDLSVYSPIVVNLLIDTMHRMQTAASYIVHVSRKDYPQVIKERDRILEETGTLPQGLEIISDMTLSQSQCMIETEGGIYDCSLGTELEALGRKLKLLSYKTS